MPNEEETFNSLRYQYQRDGYRYTVDDNNELHSYNDRPALEYPDGTRCWFKHGHLHRDKGPAIIHSNGDTFWE